MKVDVRVSLVHYPCVMEFQYFTSKSIKYRASSNFQKGNSYQTCIIMHRSLFHVFNGDILKTYISTLRMKL